MNLEDIKKICSLGTGTVGPGIALSFALAGYEVNMYGRSDASIELGVMKIHNILNSFVKNSLVEKEEVPRIMRRLKGMTKLEEAAEGTQFVIESIIEDLAAKQEIFSRMESLCAPDTIFASSTSGLSPSSIAERLISKNRFVVAHFWNPPHLIPLVEVVPGSETSQNSLDITSLLLQRIGKKPVVLNREALGFIGNRLQFAMLREAFYLIESGIASKEAIDMTMKYALGRRLSTTGPFESADLSGLDIINSIAGYLFQDLCTRKDGSTILKRLVEQGNLGAKNESGFYEWTPDKLAKINQIREDNLTEWLEKDNRAYLDF